MLQLGSNMTQTALSIRSLQCCRRPRLSTRFMACKVLHDSQSTLSHKGRVSGQDDEKFREHGWRTLENFFFPPVHHLPSFESMSSRMQRLPFLCTSAPQIRLGSHWANSQPQYSTFRKLSRYLFSCDKVAGQSRKLAVFSSCQNPMCSICFRIL